MSNPTPGELFDIFVEEKRRAQELGTFEACERERKAYIAYLHCQDAPAYAVRPGTNVIDLGARRDRQS